MEECGGGKRGWESVDLARKRDENLNWQYTSVLKHNVICKYQFISNMSKIN